MMRITTLCSAFILSILSLSLFAQEPVESASLPTDSLQPAPEVIKPAKTVKSSTVVAKDQSRENRYAFGGASEIFDAQTEYVGADSETGYRFLFI